MKTRRNIALIFSTFAILSLLVHGMLPHHHHDPDTENCKAETGLSDFHQENKNCDTFSELSTCCEDHAPDSSGLHVCNLNASASKQVTVELTAVLLSYVLRFETMQVSSHFVPVPDLFIPSVFSEVRSLRAPPLA